MGRDPSSCEALPMILANPAHRPLALSRRILPRGWADLALQLSLFAVLDLVYETTRMLAVGDRGVALRHAHDIVSAERTLRIFHELSVQRFAAHHGLVQSVANWTYFNCQFTISFGFLFWVYLRRNEAYPLVRNVFLAANAIGLACYMLYPAAPPRMLTGLGFVDTLNETSVNHRSGLIASLSNPYAAMPSLHTAYALTVRVSAVLLVRTPVLRVAWAFYPALVVFSIVATANHFFLDAAGGACVATLAALSVLAHRRRSRRLAAAVAALPVASFLVYRFAGQVSDTVSTLAAVGLGALALMAVGALFALTIVEPPGWALTSLAGGGAVVVCALVAGLLARRARVTLPSRLARLAEPARELAAGAMHIARSPRRLAVALLLAAGSWAAQIAAVCWTLDAVGLPHTVAAGSAVFLASTLLGLFPLMPGNVGVFH